ncbi:DUF317 domain-containing protein [Streptomyces brevispora]|uniref:DUF317 domain-containing protein n=1 Tax=Streptomyces brevispora TaxID=887462 RepID=UPI002E375EB6|nr:DUF317 domain-containing protein [Streptomyces brevispora]
MDASVALLPAVVRPSAESRCWLSPDYCAGPVLDFLDALGWEAADTPEANVHATSPDGRVYVGWLPEDTAAHNRGIVWHVRVKPAEGGP